jgi:hypothetical protein
MREDVGPIGGWIIPGSFKKQKKNKKQTNVMERIE